MKKRVLFSAKVVVTIIILWVVYRRIDVRQISSALRDVNYLFLSAGLALAVVVYIIDTVKLRYSLGIFNKGMKIGLGRLIAIRLVSTASIIILPGGQLTGEAVNVLRLFRYFPKTGAILSVGFDKTMGLGALMLVTFVLLIADPFRRYHLEYLFAGVILVCGVLLLAVLRVGNRIHRVLAIADRNVSNVWGRAMSAISYSFAIMAQPENHLKVITVFVLPCVSQLIAAVSIYCYACSVGVGISPAAIGWITGVLGLVQLVPVTILGLGVREATYAFFLSSYGIGYEQTILLCVLLYFMLLIYLCAGLGVFVWELFDRRKNQQPELINERH